ncbi:MAG: alternate-type signal peptide domain-containing protein [Microbacterium sp.]
MKKSTRTLLGSSIAAALGALLLLGGTGSLASWSDTETSQTQQIQSGTLDLGSSSQITTAGATIKQCTPDCTGAQSAPYTGGPIVPGDVITATVNIPVTLTGQNLTARFDVSPTKAATGGDTVAEDVALRDALLVKVTTIKTTDVSATTPTITLTSAEHSTGTIPVVIEITFPWGTPGLYNNAMGGQVTLAANYSLTQIPAG